jgi:glycolate oxidase
MALFDKYARLRRAVGAGTLHSDRDKILSCLQGHVKRQDLPALVAEPATVAGVQACVQFAAERKLPLVVHSGLTQRTAEGLGGKLLLSTVRLVSSPSFLAENTRLQVAAGVSLEALQVDLDRTGVRWPPLFPVPRATSIGALISAGWQGLRTWRHGGTLSHVAGVEWVDGEGNLHEAGPETSGSDYVDLLPFLFGSRGELGILTRADLLLEKKPTQRAACTIRLPQVAEVTRIISLVGLSSPPPDVVLLLDSGALEIFRGASSLMAAEGARAVIVCEWSDSEARPVLPYAHWLDDSRDIDELWRELFECASRATENFPAYLEGQVVLPARAFADFEAYTRAFSHDANISAALWGTVEVGHLHIWLPLPEDEPRLRQQASHVLEKLQDYSVQLGGGPTGKVAPAILKRLTPQRSSWTSGWRVRAKLKEQFDPHTIFPLRDPLTKNMFA